MNQRIKDLWDKAGESTVDDSWESQVAFIETFAELIVKKCAYLVNHQQRTTGYTTHAKMLCEEFGVDFKDEDYFGDEQ